MFSPEVRALLPPPDLSRNAALSLWGQASVLYDVDPVADTVGGEALTDLHLPSVWPVMRRRNLYTEAMGECAVRVDWSPSQNRATVRVVPGDCIVAWSDPDAPGVPTRVEELRRRTVTRDGEERQVWTWEVWDVRDPSEPVFRIEERTDGVVQDITAEVAGEAGWPAWFRDSSGAAVLPYALYHRDLGSHLWDWLPGRELVCGTLSAAGMWTWWRSLVRDVGFPQRGLIDGELVGMGTTDARPGRGERVVQTNPMAVLSIRSTDSGTARMEQWGATASPTDLALAIEQYEAGLAQHAGINPGDVHRGSHGSSGYAIVVSRDGLRRAQRRQVPAAREGDKRTLAMLATVTNRMVPGSSLPEAPKDYVVTYERIGKAPEQTRQEVDADMAEVDAGLISPVDAIMRRNPGMTEDEALARLVRNARHTALLRSLAEPEAAPDVEDNSITPEET